MVILLTLLLIIIFINILFIFCACKISSMADELSNQLDK